MTGFARARRPLGRGELVVSVKTLNHRALDMHFHAPSVVDAFENAVRATGEEPPGARARGSPGHASDRSRLKGGSAALNRPLLEEYLDAFRQAAAEHKLNAQPDLNAALRIPGMFGEAADTLGSAARNRGGDAGCSRVPPSMS